VCLPSKFIRGVFPESSPAGWFRSCGCFPLVSLVQAAKARPADEPRRGRGPLFRRSPAGRIAENRVNTLSVAVTPQFRSAKEREAPLSSARFPSLRSTRLLDRRKSSRCHGSRSGARCRRMSSCTLGEIRGRPGPDLESERQYSRNLFGCQRTTVSGRTITRALRQRGQKRRRAIQNPRLAALSRGRGCFWA